MGHQNWSSDAPCTRLNDWCKKWWVNANMIFSKDVCILVLKDFVRGLSRLIVLMLLDDDACKEARFSCNLLVKWEAFYTGLNSLFLFMDCKGRSFTTVTGLWKLNPNRSLDYYAQTNFLFVICLSVFRLQWNPIAPSKRRDIWTKTRVVIIITLMTDLG